MEVPDRYDKHHAGLPALHSLLSRCWLSCSLIGRQEDVESALCVVLRVIGLVWTPSADTDGPGPGLLLAGPILKLSTVADLRRAFEKC